MSMKIVQKFYHSNGSGAPFMVAIVDDPAEGDTKLVIMFEEEECTAVMSLDTLIESEDIGTRNSYHGDRYEQVLRDELWGQKVTTIAGIQGEGWVVIGYDSRVTEESGRVYMLPKDNGKIVKNGTYLLGAAGDMRAINILAHVFKPPICNPTMLGIKLDKFITSQFIPELKKCFEDNSYSEKGEQDSQIIVVVNGTIYEIGEDYSWCHDVVGAYAVGSGSDYALGAMTALADGKKRTLTNARATIKTALTVSQKFDNRTSEPFYLLTQYRG